MSFLWPAMLVLLVGIPLLIAGYVSLVRRRNRRVAELASQGFVPSASARRHRRLRHVPFAFFLAAVALLLLSVARPEMTLSIPHREGTVVLAFDVSNSMRAQDLEPTRMEAAKAAARAFVEKQPDSIQIGVVAFSDGGLVTQPPTTEQADVLAAIDRLSPSGATSLGQGIFTSLNAIAGDPITVDPAQLQADIESIDIGYYGSAAVILLSDGENTADPDPLAVAELASVAGVHIYPIGIGSPEGTVVDIDGFSVATALDEQLLDQIASVTDGTYYHAADAESLADVYQGIDLELTAEPEKMEVTAFLTGISIVLLLIGGVLSLVWFGRLI
jgi:Ca-activated chloride channel family protein